MSEPLHRVCTVDTRTQVQVLPDGTSSVDDRGERHFDCSAGCQMRILGFTGFQVLGPFVGFDIPQRLFLCSNCNPRDHPSVGEGIRLRFNPGASPSMTIRRIMFGLFALAELLLCIAIAQAESSNVPTTTPVRLPREVLPVRYTIDLNPDLTTLVTAGSETIEIDVHEKTNRLILNAVNITIGSATLDDCRAAGIALDAATQRVTLVLPTPIEVGSHRLRISFTSRINQFSRGLFYVDYPTRGGRKRMIATQLEPTDARRIFPCWDEPAFKAIFQVRATLPEEFSAVSNMPVDHQLPLAGGLKQVFFAATPPMSSYLFVLVAGDLGRIADHSGKVEVGVVTQAGRQIQGHYALGNALTLLDYYSGYFGVNYPLPKLDLIALPGGFGGAMENWGGITFYEGLLLYDPAWSPESLRRRIFAVVAHEMAHQWFGDLVTTAWWSDLWLNEGFADWMQAKVEDHLHPDWDVWLNEYGKEGAMYADARPMSHPIQYPIANESEAAIAFDEITYQKGAAIVRVLENYVGEGAFRSGIRAYIKAHAYGNATTEDLWQALQRVSRKPVSTIARSYTEQPGLPLITVDEKCDAGRRTLIVKQGRFTIYYPDAKPQLWQVPVNFGIAGQNQPSATALLREKTADISAGSCEAPIKLNIGDIGYYRVQYDPATLAALTGLIEGMAPADRLNLLSDNWALLEAGRASSAGYFRLVDAVARDDQRAIWRQVTSVLLDLDRLQRGLPGRSAFQAYARSILRPVLQRSGWDPAAHESEDAIILRSMLIATLGALDDPSVVAEAKRRFARFLADPASLDVNLRDAVVGIVGRNADQATYDALRKLARSPASSHDRVRYYSAMARADDPRLIKQTLDLTLSDELEPERASELILIVAAGEHPDLALAFVKKNFAALAAKRSPDFRYFFMPELMGNFREASYAKELADFAPVQESSGGRLEALRAESRILESADFRAHQVPEIDRWVKARASSAFGHRMPIVRPEPMTSYTRP